MMADDEEANFNPDAIDNLLEETAVEEEDIEGISEEEAV
jgi:hypothetical protein